MEKFLDNSHKKNSSRLTDKIEFSVYGQDKCYCYFKLGGFYFLFLWHLQGRYRTI